MIFSGVCWALTCSIDPRSFASKVPATIPCRSLIHTWLQPGVQKAQLRGNRLNGFQESRRILVTRLKPGVNERGEGLLRQSHLQLLLDQMFAQGLGNGFTLRVDLELGIDVFEMI